MSSSEVKASAPPYSADFSSQYPTLDTLKIHQQPGNVPAETSPIQQQDSSYYPSAPLAQQPVIHNVYQSAVYALPPPMAPGTQIDGSCFAPPVLYPTVPDLSAKRPASDSATTDQPPAKIAKAEPSGFFYRFFSWITSRYDSTSELASQASRIDELQKKVAALESELAHEKVISTEFTRKSIEDKAAFNRLSEEYAKTLSGAEATRQSATWFEGEKRRLEYQLHQALQGQAEAIDRLEGLKRLRSEQSQKEIEAAVASKITTIERLNKELTAKAFAIEDLTNKLKLREQTIAELRAQVVGLTDSLKRYWEGANQIQTGVGSMLRSQETALEYLAKVIADIKGSGVEPKPPGSM